MKKIPTLFVRDPADMRRVTDQVTPGCEWVLAGEGVPTEKIDGTSCMIDAEGRLWKRREVRDGSAVPEDFLLAGHANGKSQGWVPCDRDDPSDKWHFEAFGAPGMLAPGTYELVGPKVQGDPYGLPRHGLVRHGDRPVEMDGRDFDSIRSLLAARTIEGIVWHHPDGRMAKIKRRDFGFPWPLKEPTDA